MAARSVAMVRGDREKILCKILGQLGLDSINTKKFDNRLIYQKLVYLVQYSGLSIGYRFNWFIRGPYSPPLTEALFSLSEDPDFFRECSEIKFENQAFVDGKISKIEEVLGDNIKNPYFLEILGSLAYIKENDPLTRDNKNELIKRLLELKPFIKNNSTWSEQCSKAYDELQKLS